MLIDRVDGVDRSDHAARVAVLTELVAHPGAGDGLVDVAGVFDEICQHQRALGRFNEAITAKRAAITAGYRSTPDPHADIAEMFVAQGRLDEAASLFATLRERAPDDVWLYNSAAWAYATVDPGESLRWALDGIEVAFATGDPDAVIGQLRHMATEAWAAMGADPDRGLLERIDEFTATRTPPPNSTTSTLASTVSDGRGDTRTGSARHGPATALGVSWFPAGEWPTATDRWPDLPGNVAGDHQAYSRMIEAHLKTLQRTGPPGSLHVSPLTVAELDTYTAAHGDDPGSAQARAALAAELVRVGRAVGWPPRRNDRCWCQSGRKYKHCCGPTPPAALDETADG